MAMFVPAASAALAEVHFQPTEGLFTHKSDFALGLQVYNTNNIFLYSEMDLLIAKSCSEIGRINKALYIDI